MKNTEYNKILMAAHAGWWGTVVVVGLRAIGAIPQAAGSVGLLTLGVAVTCSLALSRMKLGKTITEVFNAGMKAAITLSANVFTDTCIMALDKDGRIVSVDHSDAIGWEAQNLLGKSLCEELIATRSGMPGRFRKLEPGTSITTPMLNQEGSRFDARISMANLEHKVSGDVHLDRTIATVSPVVTSQGNYLIHD